MASLVEVLYPLPDLRRTPLSALGWWEARRLKFNLIVGSAGLVTIGSVGVASLLAPGLFPSPYPELLFLALGYGALANVCYSLGWAAEMMARLIWGRKAPLIGPLLFREGLIFSVGLTLLPTLFIGLRLVLEVILSVIS